MREQLRAYRTPEDTRKQRILLPSSSYSPPSISSSSGPQCCGSIGERPAGASCRIPDAARDKPALRTLLRLVLGICACLHPPCLRLKLNLAWQTSVTPPFLLVNRRLPEASVCRVFERRLLCRTGKTEVEEII